jgi:hypothetical protein
MGTFFEHPPRKLVVGRSGPYNHWFGGVPAHRGVVPPRRSHPVHQLYDLDLRDPDLGLASRFGGLSRLPLYNALQYNCCDLVYRVASDDAIEIVSMTNPNNPDWYANHPFDNYPAAFSRHPVALEPVQPDVLDLLARVLGDNGGETYTSSASGPVRKRLRALGYPFPQVGGRQFMWQGIPGWDCRGRRCKYAKQFTEADKEVIAVVWERPAPDLHLWSDDPKYQDVGSCQIIFSRCSGCGALHSCNRCD